MKGITPVVAVIMLLMITIAVVGFAFGYFSNILETTGTEAEGQATAVADQLAKSVRIESADTANLVIRNTGSQDITTATEISIIINGTPSTACTLGATIAAGAVATCSDLTPNCGAGDIIVVSAPAGAVSGTCPISP